MDELTVRKAVRDAYAGRAADADCGCAGSGCCAPDAQSLPVIEGLPKLGLGDPVALADVKAGETVLDLGSGPGRDVFSAASLVGPTGRAIGVDATPEMIFRAREVARERGVANAEFRLGEIEHLPVETASVDVILSDCVVNLSPDKAAVFREAFRVLRPGGRVVLSDVVADRELPQAVREDARAWAGCVAGAVPEATYVELLRTAGFEDVRAVQRGGPFQDLVSTVLLIARKPSA